MRSASAPLSAAPPVGPAVSWPAPAGGAGVTGRELAERIARFYATHPAGRIVTELVTRAREVVVFRAAVYRAAGDAVPAATGWTSAGSGVGPAFERAEEAAIGRALAHLGFAQRGVAGGDARPSHPPADARAAGPDDPSHTAQDDPVPVVRPAPPADLAREALVADLVGLVVRAERYGLRPRRAAAWRARLRTNADPEPALARAEQRLRGWVERRRAEPYAGAL